MDEKHVIDATNEGGVAKYINHGCNPNCKTSVVEVNGEKIIVVFSLRKIKPGEEVFILIVEI